MKACKPLLFALACAALPAGLAAAEPATSAGQAYAEMEQMLGTVPSFMRAYPQASVAGAWEDFKNLQLSDQTALSSKHKELIGLAVAAQIPCQYCVYFHTAAAKANGASEREIAETIAMAALTRHWSTVLNGTQPDFAAFKREADAILRHAAAQSASDDR